MKKKSPAPRGFWSRVFSWIKRGICLALCIFLFIQLWFFGWILWWKWTPPAETHFMRLRLVELRQQDPEASLRHQWVDYEQISRHLKRAVLVAEDARFVEHDGFDWIGIQAAMEKNQKKGRFVAGGSTLTQQLAKNLFLSPRRSLIRKGQEALITLMIEALWDKKRIFEVYLNVIEWGNGVFGAEAAARHYYQINAARLSSWQAARLAAMTPNPRYYDSHRKTAYLTYRTASIHAQMPAARLP
ncbi:MAG: monofunctional biosynthetic peptidoglycan transglycosylase [Zoogloeaceae bacterium]|jgi:monofunctional biosynthetic peptidoglycan transglycosylase|nr:monofunctional biosynthetic peptidoglycan transglycosylase [Zoogloeaceae bacterium]